MGSEDFFGMPEDEATSAFERCFQSVVDRICAAPTNPDPDSGDVARWVIGEGHGGFVAETMVHCYVAGENPVDFLRAIVIPTIVALQLEWPDVTRQIANAVAERSHGA